MDTQITTHTTPSPTPTTAPVSRQLLALLTQPGILAAAILRPEQGLEIRDDHTEQWKAIFELAPTILDKAPKTDKGPARSAMLMIGEVVVRVQSEPAMMIVAALPKGHAFAKSAKRFFKRVAAGGGRRPQ